MRRAILGSTVAAVVITLSALLLLLMPAGGQDTAQASGGAGDYTAFGIDMDPYNGGGNGLNICVCGSGETPPDCGCETGDQCLNDLDDDFDFVSNDGCGLGPIDPCIRVDSGSFNIDIFVDDIPTGKDLGAFNYFLRYDETLVQVNERVPARGAAAWLLAAAPGSAVSQGGTRTWPNTTGLVKEATADLSGAASGEPAGSLGPTVRYELEVIGAGPTITPLTALTLTPAPHFLASNIPGLPHGYDPDEVFDGNHVPPYGLVAIGTACPGADSDGDGMLDSWEDSYACTDSETADATDDDDSDGLTHIQEYSARTDPGDADSDNDTVLDGDDADPLDAYV